MIQDAGWKGGRHLMARAYSLVCGLALLRARGHQLQKKPLPTMGMASVAFFILRSSNLCGDVRYGSKADIEAT
jgi:hypothetical protein